MVKNKKKFDATCCPTESVRRRSITNEEALKLSGLFKVLANDTRLRLLKILSRCSGQICVCDLAKEIGMKPQAISNQLQRLVDKNILSSFRKGNNVFYRIVDPCVPNLLEAGLCLIENAPIRIQKIKNRSREVIR